MIAPPTLWLEAGVRSPVQLRGPEAWQLAVYLARGENERAEKLLDALNQVHRAFGFPDYEMPEPASTGLPDLVWCPADGAEQLTEEVRGDPLLKSIDLDDDGGRVAA